MDSTLEIIDDGAGAVVSGPRKLVSQFLDLAGLARRARPLDAVTETFQTDRLRELLTLGSGIVSTAATAVEQSTMYLKLTPASRRNLTEAGGLMPTAVKGISHAMLGKTGDASMKWLQVDTSVSALLTNPAMLTGVAGLLGQFARQLQERELREWRESVTGALDDIRRRQLNDILAQVKGAAAVLDQALTVWKHGGDPQTVWDTVTGVPQALSEVEEKALGELEALADAVDPAQRLTSLGKSTARIAQDAGLQLTVLARCFELRDQHAVLWLDQVRATAPDTVEGTRAGLADAVGKRREEILTRTRPLLGQLERAGTAAGEKVLIHERTARKIIGAVNSTGTSVTDFHQALGIDDRWTDIGTMTRRDALRDPSQRRAAGAEIGTVAGSFGAVLLPLIGSAITSGDHRNR